MRIEPTDSAAPSAPATADGLAPSPTGVGPRLAPPPRRGRLAPMTSRLPACRAGIALPRAAVRALLVPLLATIALPAAAERPRVYAVTGARVVVAPGNELESGTIVLRDGLIEAVGRDVDVPGDAVEIDGSGLHVTAAFIDAHTHLGMASRPGAGSGPGGGSPPGASRGGSAPGARKGAAHPLPVVHPEERAAEALAPFSGDGTRALDKLREAGFGAVQTSPEKGVFRGTGAVLLLLDDAPVSRLLLAADTGQHLAFERGSFGEGYPTSLMGTVAAIRQAVLDARRHAEWAARYERRPVGMARPERSDALEALAPLVRRAAPAFVHAGSKDDALLALRLSGELALRAVVVGSGEEHEVADAFAAAGVPLVFPVDLPDEPDVDDEHERRDVSLREMRRFLEAPAAPARLRAAGVPLAFTAHGLSRLSELGGSVRRMIESGLSEEDALAAWTSEPARLLGLESVLGTLEQGKIANVALWDGAPFAEETRLHTLFVDGVEHRMKEKKKPEGADPEAVVDPRGEWSVVLELGPRTIERTWTIEGTPGNWSGSAETQEGTATFDAVRLEGNLLTVVFPARGGRPAIEVAVVIRGDRFEGAFEMGPRSVPIKGSRVAGPGGEGGSR